eukprot:SAG31_NODE_275_length_18666_cov_8.489309_5_plen_819_part_00
MISQDQPLEIEHTSDQTALTDFHRVIDDVHSSIDFLQLLDVLRSVLSFSSAIATTTVAVIFFYGALDCFGRGAWVAERAGCLAACPAASGLLIASVHVALSLIAADLCHEFELALPNALNSGYAVGNSGTTSYSGTTQGWSGSWSTSPSTLPTAGPPDNSINSTVYGDENIHEPVIRVPAFDRIFRCSTGHNDNGGFEYLSNRIDAQIADAHIPGCTAVTGLCADVADHHLHDIDCSRFVSAAHQAPCNIETLERDVSEVVLTERTQWVCSIEGCFPPNMTNWTINGCAIHCSDDWLRAASSLASLAVNASTERHAQSVGVRVEFLQPLLQCTFWASTMDRLYQPVCFDSVLGFFLVTVCAVPATVAIFCATVCVATAGKRLDKRRHHNNTPYRPPLDVDAIVPKAQHVYGRLRWQDLTNLVNLPTLSERMPITPLALVDDDVRPATPVDEPLDALDRRCINADEDINHNKSSAHRVAGQIEKQYSNGWNLADERSPAPATQDHLPQRHCASLCCGRRKPAMVAATYGVNESSLAWDTAFKHPHMHSEWDRNPNMWAFSDSHDDHYYWEDRDDWNDNDWQAAFGFHIDTMHSAATIIQAAGRGASVRWRMKDQRVDAQNQPPGQRRRRRAAGPATLAMAKHAAKHAQAIADQKNQVVSQCRKDVENANGLHETMLCKQLLREAEEEAQEAETLASAAQFELDEMENGPKPDIDMNWYGNHNFMGVNFSLGMRSTTVHVPPFCRLSDLMSCATKDKQLFPRKMPDSRRLLEWGVFHRPFGVAKVDRLDGAKPLSLDDAERTLAEMRIGDGDTIVLTGGF